MEFSNPTLFVIGTYLIAEGFISIWHFRKTATWLEQSIRFIRAAIGFVLMSWGL